MDAGNFRRDAFEGAAVNAVRFRVPRFELAGCAAKPEQDTVLALTAGRFRENLGSEKAAPTKERACAGRAEALKEKAAVELVLGRRARAISG